MSCTTEGDEGVVKRRPYPGSCHQTYLRGGLWRKVATANLKVRVGLYGSRRTLIESSWGSPTGSNATTTFLCPLCCNVPMHTTLNNNNTLPTPLALFSCSSFPKAGSGELPLSLKGTMRERNELRGYRSAPSLHSLYGALVRKACFPTNGFVYLGLLFLKDWGQMGYR